MRGWPLKTRCRKQRSQAGALLGANDRINVGLIGCGGRGTYVGTAFAKYAEQNRMPARSSPYAMFMRNASR